MMPVKNDPETGDFVPTDNVNYQVSLSSLLFCLLHFNRGGLTHSSIRLR